MKVLLAGALLTVVFLAVLSYEFYVEPRRMELAEAQVKANSIEFGAEIYQTGCAQCHGPQGQGGIGTAVGDPVWLALYDDDYIRRAIAGGRGQWQGSPMVAWGEELGGSLRRDEVEDLVHFIRNWQIPPCTSPGAGLPDCYSTPEDLAPYVVARNLPRYSDEQLARFGLQPLKSPVPRTWDSVLRGQALFQSCTSCHGPQGLGDGPAAAALPIRVANLRSEYVQQRVPDGEIYYLIKNGFWHGIMPAWGFLESQSPTAIWDLTNYIKSWGIPEDQIPGSPAAQALLGQAAGGS
ncbi:MAG: c-type cytochrome [Deinococcus sp.]|nr:c-type cytochrome [Deinococcus sp.]